MSTFKIITATGKQYTAMVTFAKNGGSVAVDHNGSFQTFKFDAKNVKDEGNFLVAFLHRVGYFEPTIRFKRKTYEYIEPVATSKKFPYVVETQAIYTDPDGTVKSFNGEGRMFDLLLFAELDVTTEEFINRTTIKKVYRFSNNEAINEILNYNNVTPEYVKKNSKLISVINKYITKGHNHIDPNLSGTTWRVDSVRAYRLNTINGFKKDILLIP